MLQTDKHQEIQWEIKLVDVLEKSTERLEIRYKQIYRQKFVAVDRFIDGFVDRSMNKDKFVDM